MARPWGSEYLQRTTNSEDGSDNNNKTILSNLPQDEAAVSIVGPITSHQPSQSQSQS